MFKISDDLIPTDTWLKLVMLIAISSCICNIKLKICKQLALSQKTSKIYKTGTSKLHLV